MKTVKPTNSLKLYDRKTSDLLKVKKEILLNHVIKTDCPVSCDTSDDDTMHSQDLKTAFVNLSIYHSSLLNVKKTVFPLSDVPRQFPLRRGGEEFGNLTIYCF